MEMIFNLGKHGSRFASTAFFLYSFFCIFILTEPLDSLEIRQGRVSLILHERTGHFSFYGLNEGQRRYEPLLADKTPPTSFIEVNINGRTYRLGESSIFNLRIVNAGTSTALIFESKTLRVRQEFSFIQTAGSPEPNGLQMNIRLTNLQSRSIKAGVRIVLNPRMTEKNGGIPLFINNQEIRMETVVAGNIDHFWTFRGGPLSLVGSIGTLSGANPDYLHIGDWKLINKAAWASASGTGQKAKSKTNTIENLAICYYYNPKPIPLNGEINCSILLAAEDPAGFIRSDVSPSSVRNPKKADLLLLDSIIKRLNRHLNREIEIPEQELASMAQIVRRIKSLYNLP
jgi:hypothetical protein